MKFGALILIFAISNVYAKKCGNGQCHSTDDKSNYRISTNGHCGASYGNTVCPKNQCCDKNGWCGLGNSHCGKGCQSEFGVCYNTTTTKTKKTKTKKTKSSKTKTATETTPVETTTPSLCNGSDLITCIKDIGINKLKEENYVLMERPLQDKYANLTINGIAFDIKHYELIGVGNLSMMGCDSPFFKMFTYILTPFYKDIPLLSSDYIVQGSKQDVINEIYSTVINKESPLYQEYIEKFKDSMTSCPLTDNEITPAWYDEWRPAFVNKSGSLEDTETIASLFNRNIKLFMELEQKTEFIDNVNTRVEKHNIVTEYVNNLVQNGGVSTDMFKAVLGEDQTREFFYTILFGNDCFKPSY